MEKKIISRVIEGDKKISKLVYDYSIIRGVSSSELARYLGLSVQQIQKYLNGTNRISAGVLEKIVYKLQIPVDEIFKKNNKLLKHDDHTEFRTAVFLSEFFSKIQDKSVRKAIIQLVQAIVLSK